MIWWEYTCLRRRWSCKQERVPVPGHVLHVQAGFKSLAAQLTSGLQRNSSWSCCTEILAQVESKESLNGNADSVRDVLNIFKKKSKIRVVAADKAGCGSAARSWPWMDSPARDPLGVLSGCSLRFKLDPI